MPREKRGCLCVIEFKLNLRPDYSPYEMHEVASFFSKAIPRRSQIIRAPIAVAERDGVSGTFGGREQ